MVITCGAAVVLSMLIAAKRQDEVGEGGGWAEEVDDHGGQPGVGAQVGFGLAQGPGLG
jgi:hypothetical protein